LPNCLDQLILAHDPLAVLDKVNDQIEDLRLDVNNRAGSSQFLPSDIDFEAGEAEVQSAPRSHGGLFAAASSVWMRCLHVSCRRDGVSHGGSPPRSEEQQRTYHAKRATFLSSLVALIECPIK
jgi:hypothetical protein